MTVSVRDNHEEHRWEAIVDGEVVGFAGYQRTDELVVFTHTEVDPKMEGQGIGGQLIQAAMDEVRAAGLKVLPICPFVVAWLQRNPEYADLDYRHPPSRVTD